MGTSSAKDAEPCAGDLREHARSVVAEYAIGRRSSGSKFVRHVEIEVSIAIEAAERQVADGIRIRRKRRDDEREAPATTL